MHRFGTISLVFFCLIFSGEGSVSAAVKYDVINFGTPVDIPAGDVLMNINVASININGDAVGTYGVYNTAGRFNAKYNFVYHYSNRTMTTIKLPSWPDPPNYPITSGINDSGQIVGGFQDAAYYMHGFLYSGGTYTDLTPSGQQLNAEAINNSGQVVGSWTEGHGAFLYSNGIMKDLCAFPAPYSQPLVTASINNRGDVVGFCWDPSAINHAYIYNIYSGGGVATMLPMLPGSYNGSTAYQINDLGQVVGACFNTVSDTGHGFLYSGGKMTDIGTFGGHHSTPLSINNKGQVVGYSDDPKNMNRAFLYSDGKMTDLNTLVSPSLGINLSRAVSINDNGWIVVQDENYFPYLLIPVPEPSIFILLGAGVISLLGYAWGKDKGVGSLKYLVHFLGEYLG